MAPTQDSREQRASSDYRTSNIPVDAWLCPKDYPYPAGAPLVTSVPEPNSPMAYNEDEIVFLWHRIYHIFLKIGFFRDSDVIFPPEDTGRHAVIDKALFRDKFNMNDRVISLLERLPYPAASVGFQGSVAFFPEGIIANYLSNGNMEFCRDSHPMTCLRQTQNVSTPAGDLLPDDVALLIPYESIGTAWILDTQANAIRTLSGYVEYTCRTIPENFLDERPNDEDRYRNWPAFHAPFILKRYVSDLLSLRFVPLERGGEFIYDSGQSIEAFLVAHILREEYGWPDEFRADVWYEDAERVFEAAGRTEQSLISLHGHSLDRAQMIKQWKAHPERIPDLE